MVHLLVPKQLQKKGNPFFLVVLSLRNLLKWNHKFSTQKVEKSKVFKEKIWASKNLTVGAYKGRKVKFNTSFSSKDMANANEVLIRGGVFLVIKELDYLINGEYCVDKRCNS